MVEVFKTNVKQKRQAAGLITALLQAFPMHYISFDLDDCDRILRIEGNNICITTITQLLRLKGFICEPLD
jgi:hypothetical protein